MAMVINTNIAAINTARNLTKNNNAMTSSLEKLSSGYRINTAADGPADLVISEKLRAQMNGLQKAVQNTQEASNVIGIAEGALNEMNEILKSMRALALHAANSGITSAEQIAADQAEIDSSIQTIERIATTTKYSNEFLLNGSQALTYNIKTAYNSINDTSLINTGMTQVNQVTRTNDYVVNVSYSGANATETTADTTKAAQRAFIEATNNTAGADINAAGEAITSEQKFIITGTKGSVTYSFATGITLGEIATTVNNDASSTGVGATLLFDSEVVGTPVSVNGNGAAHVAGEIEFYNLKADGSVSATGVTGVTVLSGAVVGKNCDGDGRVYLQWTSATTYVAFKDQEMTEEVGRGNTGAVMSQTNLSGLAFTVAGAGATASDVSVVQLGSIHETAGVAANVTNATATGNFGISGLSSTITQANASCLSGVRLGVNTDASGQIYMKIVASGAAAGTVNLYNSADMSEASLVAKSQTAAIGGNIKVYSENDSGIFGTLNLTLAGATVGASYTGTMDFTNFGIRLFSTEYGSDEYVKVEVNEGALFTDVDGNIVDAGSSGKEVIDYGNDATVTVNGRTVTLNGTEGDISTATLNAHFVFEQGDLGATTIAVAGYTEGALSSKVGQMTNTANYATQAIRNTTQTLVNFQGGMQFQLGEGAGDQERTVYSIESMSTSNIGKVSFFDDFDENGTKENRTLSLVDLLGGGVADLSTSPIRALAIMDQSISDVSNLRARLGATQANLLETNINSLNVAIENITATESAIRDVDMASETTEFTKNQILVQAATSMLAQANSVSQNVLSLLQ